MDEKKFQLKIDSALRDTVKKRAIDHGITMNELIIKIVKKHLENK